ncbi:MarR family winged helix-turn-helix transcriptional regulator [Vagococcus elongatus]|uniref:MarR family transcriptional regulator n=1 Tax=Vagococcus elongatus TaxID=180344 RepID=A0A430AMQ4_9ENTE|nr:MarR family winged helix-turn-helix transcriptional regulator [Vagococcus elongatus]RSU09187.1 MarR family transcriptional regulator [Vagococcus elongatus]
MESKISLRIRMTANKLNRKAAEILKEDGQPASGMQMQILNFIHGKYKQGIYVYQKDIEQVFDIRRSTATGILQTMEKRALIQRESDRLDNRLKVILLTDLGKQKVKDNISKLKMFDELLVQGVTENELEAFLIVLAKISKNSHTINPLAVKGR